MIRFCLHAMERVVALTLLAIALAPLYAAPQQPKLGPHKTASATSVHKKPLMATVRPTGHATTLASQRRAASARLARTSSSVVRGRPVRGGRVVHAAPTPAYQLHPDPDRYQSIQKALADRGYFKGDLNGTWGDDSTDAMRRFQADQKIDNDGKIDALSLISLGLGPKHDGSTAAEPRVTPTAESTSSAPLLQPSTPVTLAGGPR